MSVVLVTGGGVRVGKAIAVAVSDKPTGPFRDARGSALVTNEMTPKGTHSWEDIDPTVFTDDDGTTWLAWGNRQCYIAKLKPNMTEIDGPIREITPPHFEEGPWLHKRGKLYYLTYASLDRKTQRDEHVSYSTATSLDGPWTHRGLLTGSGKYSFTIHPGIVQFKDNWYLFLHNAALTITVATTLVDPVIAPARRRLHDRCRRAYHLLQRRRR